MEGCLKQFIKVTYKNAFGGYRLGGGKENERSGEENINCDKLVGKSNIEEAGERKLRAEPCERTQRKHISKGSKWWDGVEKVQSVKNFASHLPAYATV